MHTKYLCPCCGHPELTTIAYAKSSGDGLIRGLNPPYSALFGEPSYEVCPCCGFEFGNDNAPGTAAVISFEHYLAKWSMGGEYWFEEEKKPERWSLREQLSLAAMGLRSRSFSIQKRFKSEHEMIGGLSKEACFSGIPVEIADKLRPLLGVPCTLKRLQSYRELFVDFGPLKPSKRHSEREYADWHIFVDWNGWRFMKDGLVLCGRNDVVGNIQELDANVRAIELGAFAGMAALNEFDVRVFFSCGSMLDLLTTYSDPTSELFNFFIPDNEIILYSLEKGWEIGPLNEPWYVRPDEK